MILNFGGVGSGSGAQSRAQLILAALSAVGLWNLGLTSRAKKLPKRAFSHELMSSSVMKSIGPEYRSYTCRSV